MGANLEQLLAMQMAHNMQQQGRTPIVSEFAGSGMGSRPRNFSATVSTNRGAPPQSFTTTGGGAPGPYVPPQPQRGPEGTLGTPEALQALMRLREISEENRLAQQRLDLHEEIAARDHALRLRQFGLKEDQFEHQRTQDDRGFEEGVRRFDLQNIRQQGLYEQEVLDREQERLLELDENARKEGIHEKVLQEMDQKSRARAIEINRSELEAIRDALGFGGVPVGGGGGGAVSPSGGGPGVPNINEAMRRAYSVSGRPGESFEEFSARVRPTIEGIISQRQAQADAVEAQRVDDVAAAGFQALENRAQGTIEMLEGMGEEVDTDQSRAAIFSHADDTLNEVLRAAKSDRMLGSERGRQAISQQIDAWHSVVKRTINQNPNFDDEERTRLLNGLNFRVQAAKVEVMDPKVRERNIAAADKQAAVDLEKVRGKDVTPLMKAALELSRDMPMPPGMLEGFAGMAAQVFPEEAGQVFPGMAEQVSPETPAQVFRGVKNAGKGAVNALRTGWSNAIEGVKNAGKSAVNALEEPGRSGDLEAKLDEMAKELDEKMPDVIGNLDKKKRREVARTLREAMVRLLNALGIRPAP